jgi:hypothetical protein
MERPKEFADREFLTDDEAAARAQAASEPEEEQDDPEDPRDAAQAAGARPSEKGIFGQEYNRFWVVQPPATARPWKRTSLVVDPPDGRIPPLTPEAIKRLEARETARRGRGEADSWEDRNLSERCLVAALTQLGAAKHILQAPGYVVIVNNALNSNEPQIIPLGGRPRLGDNVRTWLGESRGRWEGHTLVVETIKFNGKQDGGPIMPKRTPLQRYLGSGETLRLIERYTRVDAETLEYQYTLEDPKVYVTPYTVLRPMTKQDDRYLMLESGCHEGNYGIVGQLSAARADEAYAMEAAREEAASRQTQLQAMKRRTEEWMKTPGGRRP